MGLCRLLALPSDQRPTGLSELAPEILPSIVLLFEGLQRAYAARARESDDESSDDDDDEECEDVLSSDEDDLDDTNEEYLERLGANIIRGSNKMNLGITAKVMNESAGAGDVTVGGGDNTESDDDDDYNDLDEDDEDEMLEGYTTPLDDENSVIDEYVVFKDVLTTIQAQEPQWYGILASKLNDTQSKSLHEALVRADQRRAAIESKQIEQSGGKSKIRNKKLLVLRL